MNQSFQKFTLILMQFSIGKKINSKFGFKKRKPDFGFKTENRISGFRLTSLKITYIHISTYMYTYMHTHNCIHTYTIDQCCPTRGPHAARRLISLLAKFVRNLCKNSSKRQNLT